MTTKKHLRLLYVLLVLSIGSTCFYFISNQQLRLRLGDMEKEKIAFAQQRELQEQLRHIDSMLVEGENYSEAVEAYTTTQFNQPIEDDFMGIELRVALAKKLQQLQDEHDNKTIGSDQLPQIDSLQQAQEAFSREKALQQIDSLAFALEKAKVRLTQLQGQTQKRASGDYLTFTSSKGSKIDYVGEVKNGKANGYGIAILSTGSRYEGQWKDNRRHGQGRFYWSDGEYYVGHFQNDKRSGEGTYYWPNGEKFVGLWENDERTGEGVFYGKKGDVVASGLWEDDELVIVNKSSDK